MVASHTETPLGVSKWLEQELSQKYQPAFTVGDMVNSCPLHSSKVVFVWCRFTSHLLSLASRTVTVGSKHLKAFLYGWLPLSDASGIGYSEKREFVKEYSNFDPKKQGVLTTKGTFGRKNGDFCGFR